MASSRRCARCGYVLRYSATGYSCDFCGLRGSRSISSTMASIERSLRERVRKFLVPSRNVTYHRPMPVQLRTCVFCGFILPQGSTTCPGCGSARTESLMELDKRVFDYILIHEGTISISQGAQELSISTEALTAAIERLKTTGVLNQE